VDPVTDRAAGPREAFPDRPAPANLEAERAVLGLILLEPNLLSRAIELLLTADDFHKEGHRQLYAAMGRLLTRGVPTDALLVAEELKRAGELDDVGGQAALATMVEEATVATQFEAYVAEIRTAAIKRRLAHGYYRLSADALNGDDPRRCYAEGRSSPGVARRRRPSPCDPSSRASPVTPPRWRFGMSPRPTLPSVG
jgi:DnaB-like helicase N terminal domain